MCDFLTRSIKYGSVFVLVSVAIALLPRQWMRTLAWIAIIVYWLFRTTILRIVTNARLSVSTSPASPTSTVSTTLTGNPRKVLRMICIEGAQATGKSYTLEQHPAVWWQRTFNCVSVAIVPETINQRVLAYYSEDHTDDEPCPTCQHKPGRTPEYSFLFEIKMVEKRLREHDQSMHDVNTAHIHERSLIGCHAFHVVNYTLGYLTLDDARDLMQYELLRKMCGTAPATGRGTEIIVVYCVASFDVCRERLKKRAHADKGLGERYHAVVLFVYAYLMLEIASSYKHIGMFTHDALPETAPTKNDYGRGRNSVINAALSNIDITMSAEEKQRFIWYVGNTSPHPDIVWRAGANGNWRCCSKQRLTDSADDDGDTTSY